MPQDSLSLSKTLGRLVRVARITWTPTYANFVDIGDVYALWLADTHISKKIDGYRYFRGKPKITVMVNGYSFFYGKFVIAGSPSPGADGTPTQAGTVGFVPNDKFALVQLPHISVDPSMSRTYELYLPFLSTTGWYDMYTKFTKPSLRLLTSAFNPLTSSTAVAPTNVTMEVYISMEDVELTVPGYSQSSEIKLDGLLSGPIAAVSDFARRNAKTISNVFPKTAPFITPVTGMMTNAAEILKNLGYSSPAFHDHQSFVQLPNTVSGSFNHRDASHRFVADTKAYVAIDNAPLGFETEEDDQLIYSICRRWGYVNTINWTTAGGMLNLLDYHPLVGPDILGDKTLTRATPLCHMSAIHAYYSGGLELKVEVVASQYHRGAFGIVVFPYPLSTLPVGFDPDDAVNKYKTTIIDITTTKETIIHIPYFSARNSLRVPKNPWHIPTGISDDENYFSCTLFIYDVNPLVTAGGTSPVYLNFYLRGGEDFKLYKPIAPNIRRVEAVSQSMVQSLDSIFSADSNVIKPLSPDNSLIVYGEQSTTIKQLLSIPVQTFAINSSTAGVGDVSKTVFPVWPLSGKSSTDWGDSQTLLQYLGVAFMAFRGGVRWKIAPFYYTCFSTTNGEPSLTPCHIQLELVRRTTSLPTKYVTESIDVTTQELIVPINAMIRRYWDESAFEFAIPSFIPTKFYNFRKLQSEMTNQASLLEAPVVSMYTPSVSDGSPLSWRVFQCGDEDATLHGYLNAPLLKFLPLT